MTDSIGLIATLFVLGPLMALLLWERRNINRILAQDEEKERLRAQEEALNPKPVAPEPPKPEVVKAQSDFEKAKAAAERAKAEAEKAAALLAQANADLEKAKEQADQAAPPDAPKT